MTIEALAGQQKPVLEPEPELYRVVLDDDVVLDKVRWYDAFAKYNELANDFPDKLEIKRLEWVTSTYFIAPCHRCGSLCHHEDADGEWSECEVTYWPVVCSHCGNVSEAPRELSTVTNSEYHNSLYRATLAEKGKNS